jgi:uncharacterized protein DUF5990
MRLTIRGHHLPGREFTSDGVLLRNVHVGVQVRSEPVDLVPGDAATATWEVTVRVADDDGELDFFGPAVHGKRGERFLYLTWGDLGGNGSFARFRRAKLMLDRIDPDLVRAAQRGVGLVATVDLTDDRQGPRCARVDPPAIAWSVG